MGKSATPTLRRTTLLGGLPLRISETVTGQETFLGVGQWTEDDGSFANVTVAIARASSTTSADAFEAKLTQRLKAEQSDLEKVDRSRLQELR